MIKEYDRVMLKNGDDELNISSEEIGCVVDISEAPKLGKGFTVEFFTEDYDKILKALMKTYEEEELVLVEDDA